jgi:hypothetical protein
LLAYRFKLGVREPPTQYHAEVDTSFCRRDLATTGDGVFDFNTFRAEILRREKMRDAKHGDAPLKERATLPFGSALANAPKEKNVKVTLVYQHELPNVPGKSIKGVLVEYGPGGYSPGHTHPKSAFIYATVLEGAIRSQVNDGPGREGWPECRTGDRDLRGRVVRVLAGPMVGNVWHRDARHSALKRSDRSPGASSQVRWN